MILQLRLGAAIGEQHRHRAQLPQRQLQTGSREDVSIGILDRVACEIARRLRQTVDRIVVVLTANSPQYSHPRSKRSSHASTAAARIAVVMAVIVPTAVAATALARNVRREEFGATPSYGCEALSETRRLSSIDEGVDIVGSLAVGRGVEPRKRRAGLIRCKLEGLLRFADTNDAPQRNGAECGQAGALTFAPSLPSLSRGAFRGRGAAWAVTVLAQPDDPRLRGAPWRPAAATDDAQRGADRGGPTLAAPRPTGPGRPRCGSGRVASFTIARSGWCVCVVCGTRTGATSNPSSRRSTRLSRDRLDISSTMQSWTSSPAASTSASPWAR